jgi:peptidyl-prolyl cis-trans isomerase SurA
MVDELILLQRAKELGLSVTDAQFNDVLAAIKRDNKIESDELFEAALKSEGITLAQLRESLSKRMLVGQVQRREVGGRFEVTEAEERAYYEAHPEDFATTPSVTLREFVVNAELDPVKKAASVGALDDARAKAEAMRARILKGESFEKLAGELSDSASKANAGLIGPLSREELNEQLAKLISTMKVGDITPVMNSSTGAQFFKLEASVDSTTMSFEAARSRIADRLSQEKFAAELRKAMQRLRSQALIEWKNEELRKAWETGLTAEPTF